MQSSLPGEKNLCTFFSSILITRIHWISEEYPYTFCIFSLASKEFKALFKDANNARLIKKKIQVWKIRMGKIRWTHEWGFTSNIVPFFSLPGHGPDICSEISSSRCKPSAIEGGRRWSSSQLLGSSSIWALNIVLTLPLAQDFRSKSTLGSLRLYGRVMKCHGKLLSNIPAKYKMDQGIRRPLVAGEMTAGWKSRAKDQPIPWFRSRNHGNSGAPSSTTNNDALKGHQEREEPLILPGWALGEGGLCIFYS